MAKLDPLGEAARRLQAANPIAFHDMLSALSDLEQDALRACAAAPAGEVLVAQGHARCMEWFLRTFRECTIDRPK